MKTCFRIRSTHSLNESLYADPPPFLNHSPPGGGRKYTLLLLSCLATIFLPVSIFTSLVWLSTFHLCRTNAISTMPGSLLSYFFLRGKSILAYIILHIKLYKTFILYSILIQLSRFGE